MAKVQALNERQQALKNVVIEALSNGRLVATAQTNTAGIADFPTLNAAAHAFKPRLTRASGALGKMSMDGAVHITVLTDAPTPKLEPQKPRGPVNLNMRSRPSADPLEDLEGGGGLSDFGILRWDTDGIVYYFDDTTETWIEWGPALPTADPGGGLIWLSAS